MVTTADLNSLLADGKERQIGRSFPRFITMVVIGALTCVSAHIGGAEA